MGKIDDEGFLHIIGRKKDVIIRGGFNISPKRIEDFIINHDLFNEYVVLGVPDELLGERIVCFYVQEDETFQLQSLKMLNNNIIENLGVDYKIDEFFPMSNIPKTNTSKIDKPAIRSLYNNKKLHL